MTPSQEDFDTARTVLEFMLAHTKENEPSAFNAIIDYEAVLEANGFDAAEFE